MRTRQLLIVLVLAVIGTRGAQAQDVQEAQGAQASISFDETTYDFGTFSDSEAKKECVFTFTNVGDAPLVLNQVVASCGCTVPKYTKEPIQPGEKGKIDVTYNTRGRFAGPFKKTLTVRTNGEPSMVKLFIKGVMTDSSKEKE